MENIHSLVVSLRGNPLGFHQARSGSFWLGGYLVVIGERRPVLCSRRIR